MTTLLYSGNVGLGQDLGTVLKAVARLNGSANLKVLIVGGGKGLSEFQALASQLGLKNVEFRPPVALDQLSSLLAEGDIHVICQKPGTEGLLVPSKTYGTLAVGRASLFVGPAHCEVAAILEDSRSGFVVEPGNVEKAKQALQTLALSPALREDMGRNARDYYEYYFGRDKSVAQIIAILEKTYEDAGPSDRADANIVAGGSATGSESTRRIGVLRRAVNRFKRLFSKRRSRQSSDTAAGRSEDEFGRASLAHDK
jgi:glycosyltransferase involved in cell wall biosynthesis